MVWFRPLPLAGNGARLRIGRLHVITDHRRVLDVEAAVRGALEAGAPVVQARMKGVTDREFYEVARVVADLCRAHGAVCLVNDRPDIAVAIAAEGVHLGAGDMPVVAARRLLGDRLLIGGTARDPETAMLLEAEGVDYLGVGPIYATTTKNGLPDALGSEGVAKVAAAVSVPVIAIGGITAERIPDVIDAGAYGVAVVEAVSAATDSQRATQELLAALEAAR